MKKIPMLIAVCALLFGCEAAAVKEVKATAVPDTENDGGSRYGKRRYNGRCV